MVDFKLREMFPIGIAMTKPFYELQFRSNNVRYINRYATATYKGCGAFDDP